MPDLEGSAAATMAARLDEIEAELRRGDVIGAYDRARAGLEAGIDDPRLRYLSVLALARSGATAKAARQYRALGLHRAGDTDSASLWARIRKDAALAAPPETRPHRLARAAQSYAAVFRRTNDPFPGINAATLALLAGAEPAARDGAARLLLFPTIREPADYYAAATRAEALVILRRWEEAASALAGARGLAAGDVGALSTTRRQLAILLEAMRPEEGVAGALLAAFRLPRVAHLAGIEILPGDEAGIAARAAVAMRDEDVGFAVGTLWTTGALALAEAAVAGGAELHLVLPCPPGDYLAQVAASGRPGGEIERRRRCLAAAAAVTAATADGDFPDPRLVEYAALIAVGLAETRAARLSTDLVRITVAATRPGTPSAGPAASGRAHAFLVAKRAPAGAAPPRLAGGPRREIRALLFADVFRFSTIPESRLPGFWSDFMGGLGAAIEEAGRAVLYRNTWGDALFLVLADIEAAAELALRLQERAAALRAVDRSVPELRIGLHHGPVFRGWDPIRKVASYYGTQVSRAARVEPVAPPGAVFVTEPFAAILATAGSRGFQTDYVGRMPLPKKYGEHRMYRLARRWPGPDGTDPGAAQPPNAPSGRPT